MNSQSVLAWAAWLFALWWLYVAGQDYSSSTSPRYKSGRALFLALIAAGELAWLGSLLLEGLTPMTWVLLIAFSFTWLLWSRKASPIKSLLEEGGRLYISGQLEAAAEKWEEARTLAEKYSKAKDVTLLYGLLGAAYLGRGLISDAEKMFIKSCDKARNERFWDAEAHALRNLANIYTETGEGTRAIKTLQEVQKLYENHNDQLGATDEKSNQGRVYRLLYDSPKAFDEQTHDLQEFGKKALFNAQKLHEEAFRCYISWLQKNEGRWTGQPSNSVPLTIREYRDRAANQLGSIADTYRLLGNPGMARMYYEQQQQVGLGIVFLEDMSGLALCYIEEGERQKALNTMQLAFSINERDKQLQDPRTEYLLYLRSGYLFEKIGEMSKACTDYEMAMKRLDSLRHTIELKPQNVASQRIGLLSQSERNEAARRLILLLAKRQGWSKDTSWKMALNILERSRARVLLEELSRDQLHPATFEEARQCLQDM